MTKPEGTDHTEAPLHDDAHDPDAEALATPTLAEGRAGGGALQDVVAASHRIAAVKDREVAALHRQLATLRDRNEALDTENAALKARLADGCLAQRRAVNLRNLSHRLGSQRRTRAAALARQEASERSAMAAHDDTLYVRRDDAAEAPLAAPTLAIVASDCVGLREATTAHPHLASLVEGMYAEVIDAAAHRHEGYLSHRSEDAALHAFTSVAAAAAFAGEVQLRCAALPWPEAVVAGCGWPALSHSGLERLVARRREDEEDRARRAQREAEERQAAEVHRRQQEAAAEAVRAEAERLKAERAREREAANERSPQRGAARGRGGARSRSTVSLGAGRPRQLSRSTPRSPSRSSPRTPRRPTTGPQTPAQAQPPPEPRRPSSPNVEVPAPAAAPAPSREAPPAPAPEPAVAAAAEVDEGPDVQWLFRGPRPRIAVAVAEAFRDYHVPTGRWRYTGAAVSEAVAAVVAASPGDVVVGATGRRALQDDEAATAEGHPVLGRVSEAMEHRRAARAEAGVPTLEAAAPEGTDGDEALSMLPAALRRRQVFWAMAPGRVAAAANAAQRWLLPGGSRVWPGGGGSAGRVAVLERRFAQSASAYLTAAKALRSLEAEHMLRHDTRLDPQLAPPGGSSVVIVAVRVAHLPHLQATVTAAGALDTALGIVARNVSSLAAAQHPPGYIAASEPGATIAAFHDAQSAVNFAGRLHMTLLGAAWAKDVEAATPSASTDRGAPLFAGLSVAVGIHLGDPHREWDSGAGVMVYGGLDVTLAAMAAAGARGGETLVTDAALKSYKRAMGGSTQGLSLQGRGHRQLVAGRKGEDVTSVLPALLAPRFKIWAEGSAAAAGAGEPAALSQMWALLQLRRDAEAPNLTAVQARRLRQVPRLLRSRRRWQQMQERLEQQLMAARDTAGMLGEVPPPSGRVAVVVMDLQGSAALHQQLGEAFVRAQQRYNRCVQEHIAAHDGYRVKHSGHDAFVVAFPDPVAALAFAAAVQVALVHTTEWPPELSRNEQHGLRVKDVAAGRTLFAGPRCRMGIAFGDATSTFDPHTQRTDYAGPVLLQAGRVSRLGHGGDVRVTGEVMQRFLALRARGDPDPLSGYVVHQRPDPFQAGTPCYTVLPAVLAGRLKHLPTTSPSVTGRRVPDTKATTWWKTTPPVTNKQLAAKLGRRKRTTSTAPPPEEPDTVASAMDDACVALDRRVAALSGLAATGVDPSAAAAEIARLVAAVQALVQTAAPVAARRQPSLDPSPACIEAITAAVEVPLSVAPVPHAPRTPPCTPPRQASPSHGSPSNSPQRTPAPSPLDVSLEPSGEVPSGAAVQLRFGARQLRGNTATLNDVRLVLEQFHTMASTMLDYHGMRSIFDANGATLSEDEFARMSNGADTTTLEDMMHYLVPSAPPGHLQSLLRQARAEVEAEADPGVYSPASSPLRARHV